MTRAPYWQGDGVSIYNADALDVLPLIESIGAIVTDPPYSSGGMFRGDRTQSTVAKYVDTRKKGQARDFAGDTRDQRSYAIWVAEWMRRAFVQAIPGASAMVFTDWRQLAATADGVQVGGWILRNIATWWKPGVRMQRGRFSSSAEFVVYATAGIPEPGRGSPQNVFKCPNVKDREHIAEKPREVMQWLLQAVPAGALVVDPFCG